MKWLIDTNVALYFLAGRLEERLPDGDYLLSVITEIELLCYPDLDPASEETIRTFIAGLERVELSNEVIQTAINFRRTYNLKLPDAVIAATAFVTGATLLTNDTKLLRVLEITCRPATLKQ